MPPPAKKPAPPPPSISSKAASVKRVTTVVSTGPLLVSKLTTELLGTALLTFTVAVAAGQGAALAPIAIASTFMCAIYAGGHVSGANYNPAVTFAIFIRGKLGICEALMYVIVQLLGGMAGGASAIVLEPAWSGMGSWWPSTAEEMAIGFPAKGAGVSDMQALIAEVVFTFALCHTVLHVSTTSVQDGNSYYGLAIGFTLLAGIVSVGGVSGGAFNPAVGMLEFVRLTYSSALNAGAVAELHVFRDTFFSGAWIHTAGPFVGGTVAGLLFRLTHPKECGDGAVFKSLRETLAPFVIELVGTFLLAYTVATSQAPSNGSSLAPLAIGSILMSQIYAGGATSGAHYNPAVTIAVSLRRALASWESKLLVPPLVGFFYILVQLIGALCGGLLASMTVPVIGFPAADLGVRASLSFTTEVIASFFLCLVVLQTATVQKMANKEYFGLAIGFTLVAMLISIGGISGGAMNPAVGILGRIDSTEPFGLATTPWYYLAGPATGGVLAALAFRVISADSFIEPSNGRGMV